MTNEQRVKSEINENLSAHVVTELRNDGMCRHYRCSIPGSSNMRFDVVTWPGSLCYTGDMGDYLFQRTEDMIAFVRDSSMSYGYMAEKCNAQGREGIKEFCEPLFQRAIAYVVAEADMENLESTIEKVEGIKNAYTDGHSAYAAMSESGLFDELPSCEDFTFKFLWCLHALKWFVEKLDAGEVVRAPKHDA